MIYIDNTQYPDAIASVTMARINDQSEEILILAFPATDHDAIRALLDPAQEIRDEKETTISRYIPRICYDIADMDGRTWAKIRLRSRSTGDNPAYYQALHTEAEQQITALELARATAEQNYTAAMLHAAALEGGTTT